MIGCPPCSPQWRIEDSPQEKPPEEAILKKLQTPTPTNAAVIRAMQESPSEAAGKIRGNTPRNADTCDDYSDGTDPDGVGIDENDW